MKSDFFCSQCRPTIPSYINGTLSSSQIDSLEMHLAVCESCQQDFIFWQAVSTVVREEAEYVPSTADVDVAWQKMSTLLLLQEKAETKPVSLVLVGIQASLYQFLEHLWAQMRIIKRDFWWIVFLGLPIIALTLLLPYPWQVRADTSAWTASFVAALGMTIVYSREVDPISEMVCVTPTSLRVILFYRLFIVFVYNILINAFEVLPFFLSHSPVTFQWLIGSWFAPLCCLMAIALLLNILFKSFVSLAVCTLLWLARMMGTIFFVVDVQKIYEGFWHQSILLFILSTIAILLSFILIGRKEQFAI